MILKTKETQEQALERIEKYRQRMAYLKAVKPNERAKVK